MANDIVTRLRELILSGEFDRNEVRRLKHDAADEIERLKKLLDQAIYSMCTGDYKEQEAVACSIKTEMQQSA